MNQKLILDLWLKWLLSHSPHHLDTDLQKNYQLIKLIGQGKIINGKYLLEAKKRLVLILRKRDEWKKGKVKNVSME